MVGGLVHNQDVGTEHHHPGQHAAHFFAAGEHVDRFLHVVAGEEHLAEETAQIRFRGVLRVLFQPFDDAQITAVEVCGVVLREVRLGGGYAPFEASLVGFQFFHQNLEQRRGDNIIFGEEGDLIALVDTETDVVEHLDAVNRFGEVFHLQNFLARFAVHRKADKRVPAARGGHFLHGDLFQQLFAGGRLLGFALVGGETLDKRLKFLDLFFRLFVLVAHHALHQLAGFIPEVVVSHIELDLIVIDVYDMGADVVQEMAVMGHDDHRALVIREKIFQPGNGPHVEVVCRFVQKDDIRMAKQRLCQQYLHLFVARQGVHLGIQQHVVQSQAL